MRRDLKYQNELWILCPEQMDAQPKVCVIDYGLNSPVAYALGDTIQRQVFGKGDLKA